MNFTNEADTWHIVWAVGRDGQERAYGVSSNVTRKRYDLADAGSEFEHWEFRAWADGAMPGSDDQGFRLTVVAASEHCAIVTEMFADQPQYRERGLAEALIELAALLTGRHIVSSTNSAEHTILRGEYRTTDAEKVWERLRSTHRARYVTRIHRWLFRARTHLLS